MSILVSTRITPPTGKFSERKWKVGISVDDVTLGDIGRYLWPDGYDDMICSAAQIYDEDVDGYVDTWNPDEFIVESGNKIRFNFVQSETISVIRLPTSYASEGTITVIGESTSSDNIRLLENDVSASAKVPEVVLLPTKPDVPQFAPGPRKLRRLISPDLQIEPDVVDLTVSSPEPETETSPGGQLLFDSPLILFNGQFAGSTSHETSEKAPAVVKINRHQMDEPSDFGNSKKVVLWREKPISPQDPVEIAPRLRKLRRLSPIIQMQPDVIVTPGKSSLDSQSAQILISASEVFPQQPDPAFIRYSPRPAKRRKMIFEPSEGQSYVHLPLPSPVTEIQKHPEAWRILDEYLRPRFSRVKQKSNTKRAETLSTVMANWLNANAPGHSINFRRAFVQNFLSELLSKQTCNIQVFTNLDCSGKVDKLIVQRDLPEKIAAFYDENLFSFRDTVINRIKLDELEIDEYFHRFPYVLVRMDFLEDDFQHTCKSPATMDEFINNWKNLFTTQILNLFDKRKLAISNGQYSPKIRDKESLRAFIKLSALANCSSWKCVPQKLVIFVNGKTDEKIVRKIRTKNAIAHPVILADNDGYRLFVGNRIIFRHAQSFLHALAQLIIVTNLFDIPPVNTFRRLWYVLNRMYGTDTVHWDNGENLFRALQDIVVVQSSSQVESS